MLKSLKIKPAAKAAAARNAGHLLAGWRYRMERWRGLPAPLALPSPKLETPPEDPEFKHLSFTFAVIALSAQVACACGKPSRESYAAFREAFPLRGQLCMRIRSLFAMACESSLPYAHYVTQIRQVFPGQLALFTELVDRLFRIAAADGPVRREEERLIADVSHMLGLTPAEYLKIRARHIAPAQAHHILGITAKPAPAALKQRYRELMRRWHPDRFAGAPVTPEIEMLLQLRSSEINKAYRTLRKQAA